MTVKVQVKLSWPIWETVGARVVTLEVEDGATAQQVLAELGAQYPDFQREFAQGAGDGSATYSVFVNDKLVDRWSLAETPVHDGDRLYVILPVVGGGRDNRRQQTADRPLVEGHDGRRSAVGGRLSRDFYDRSTLDVARELLGCRLVRVLDGQRVSGFIVETEAYIGEDDQASHASVGRTPRNAVMYGPPGHAYVYLIYGVHHCLNAVTEAEGYPAAVLIRALVPDEGVEVMRRNRPGKDPAHLTDGPAKVCQALAIDLRLNGTDLVAGDELFIEAGLRVAPGAIKTSPRIGVRGDELARTRPWRFYVQPRPNIILIGFSTTGKSRVGRLLARRLGWDFVDTDDLIVERAGKSIPDIFADEGELHFRDLEREALEQACARERTVIATGGGAILERENRELMRERGWVVCLEARPETIYRRLKQAEARGEPDVVRPLLACPDPLARIIRLKEIRQPYYALADCTIHTDDLTQEQVAEEILLAWSRGEAFLSPSPSVSSNTSMQEGS